MSSETYRGFTIRVQSGMCCPEVVITQEGFFPHELIRYGDNNVGLGTQWLTRAKNIIDAHLGSAQEVSE